MKKSVKHRSSKSGRYTTPEEAKANPDSTVAETEGLTKLERAVVEACKAEHFACEEYHRVNAEIGDKALMKDDPLFETYGHACDKWIAAGKARGNAVRALIGAESK